MHRTHALALGLIVFSATAALSPAQSRFQLREPPKLLTEVTVDLNVMLPLNVHFSNLGTVDGQYNYFHNNQPTEDGQPLPSFANGAFGFDQSFYDANGNFKVPDGYSSMEEALKSASSHNFGYDSAAQLVTAGDHQPAPPAPPPGGSADKYEVAAYLMKGTPTEALNIDDQTAPKVGWGVQWARYFNEKRHFGLVAGFSTNGVKSERTATWSVDATGEIYYFAVSDNALGVDGFNSGSYYVDPIIIQGQKILRASPRWVEMVENHDFGTYDASGKWTFNAGLYTFRFGGVYNLDLTRALDMRFSGGLHAMLVNSDLTWNESFTADNVSNPVTDSRTERRTVFKFGAWADAGATVRINNRTTFFGSVQYQQSTDFNQHTSDGIDVKLDSAAMVYAKTGFNWAF